MDIFRGIIWPRKKEIKEQVWYHYTVVGVILSDKPIDNVGGNEHLLNGYSHFIRMDLEKIKQFPPATIIGDANDVLTRLSELVASEDFQK
jgi:hypothetical protein